MGVKVELEKKECATIANGLLFYIKDLSNMIKTDKDKKGKKLDKKMRLTIAEILERAKDLRRFFLIVG